MMRLMAIARNAFVETMRQPIFGVLILVTFVVLVMDVPLSGYSMGRDSGDYKETDQLLMVNLGLSTLLMSGLLMSAFAASGVLAREIEDRTVLTVISKPVGRSLLVAGKYLGVAGAIAVGYYLCSLALLMTIRHGVMPTASDRLDVPVIVLGASAVGVAVAAALLCNYLFGWHVISTAVGFAAASMTVAMGLLSIIGKGWTSQRGVGIPAGAAVMAVLAAGVTFGGVAHALWGWRFGLTSLVAAAIVGGGLLAAALIGGDVVIAGGHTHADVTANWLGRYINTHQPLGTNISTEQIEAIVLTLLSVLVFVAVAVAASTRFDMVMTLVFCLGFFVVGLISQALFERFSDENVAAWLVHRAWPNFSYFLALDALLQGSRIPLSYIGLTAAYAVCQIVAIVAIGMALFQRRELERQAVMGAPFGMSVIAFFWGIDCVICVIVGAALLGRLEASLALRAIGIGTIAMGVLQVYLLAAFMRGRKWAYFVVLGAAMLLLAQAILVALGAGFLFFPRWRLRGISPEDVVLVTTVILVPSLILAILLFPTTRRFFFHVGRRAQEVH